MFLRKGNPEGEDRVFVGFPQSAAEGRVSVESGEAVECGEEQRGDLHDDEVWDRRSDLQPATTSRHGEQELQAHHVAVDQHDKEYVLRLQLQQNVTFLIAWASNFYLGISVCACVTVIPTFDLIAWIDLNKIVHTDSWKQNLNRVC